MADEPKKEEKKLSDVDMFKGLKELLEKELPEAVKSALAKQEAAKKATEAGNTEPLPPLTAQEKVEVAKLLKETQAEDALIQTIKDLGKGVNAETIEWVKQMAENRSRQESATAVEKAKMALAAVAGDSPLSGNVIPLTSEVVHRSITAFD